MVFMDFPNRLGLVLMGLVAGWATASRAATTNGSNQLPLELKHGRLVIPAQINVTNRIWLMLDTGFSISLIDPRLAEALKLKRIGKTTIAGIAGVEQADLFEGAVFDFVGTTYAPRRVAALGSDKKKRARRMEGILGA